jgi:hypothetical protein
MAGAFFPPQGDAAAREGAESQDYLCAFDLADHPKVTPPSGFTSFLKSIIVTFPFAVNSKSTAHGASAFGRTPTTEIYPVIRYK